MSDLIIIVSDSDPNRMMLSPAATLTPKATREERQIANGVLLRLQPNQPGLLTAIIGSGIEANDIEAIVTWLRNNSHRLDVPVNPQQCYRAIKRDIDDEMSWEGC